MLRAIWVLAMWWSLPQGGQAQADASPDVASAVDSGMEDEKLFEEEIPPVMEHFADFLNHPEDSHARAARRLNYRSNYMYGDARHDESHLYEILRPLETHNATNMSQIQEALSTDNPVIQLMNDVQVTCTVGTSCLHVTWGKKVIIYSMSGYKLIGGANSSEAYRVFHVHGGGWAWLVNVEMHGALSTGWDGAFVWIDGWGRLTAYTVKFTGNICDGCTGAAIASRGSVRLYKSGFEANAALNGSAIKTYARSNVVYLTDVYFRKGDALSYSGIGSLTQSHYLEMNGGLEMMCSSGIDYLDWYSEYTNVGCFDTAPGNCAEPPFPMTLDWPEPDFTVATMEELQAAMQGLDHDNSTAVIELVNDIYVSCDRTVKNFCLEVYLGTEVTLFSRYGYKLWGGGEFGTSTSTTSATKTTSTDTTSTSSSTTSITETSTSTTSTSTSTVTTSSTITSTTTTKTTTSTSTSTSTQTSTSTTFPAPSPSDTNTTTDGISTTVTTITTSVFSFTVVTRTRTTRTTATTSTTTTVVWYRIMQVDGTLELMNLQLTGGWRGAGNGGYLSITRHGAVTATGCRFYDNEADRGWGGAISVSGGSLSVNLSTFEGNRVRRWWNGGNAIAAFGESSVQLNDVAFVGGGTRLLQLDGSASVACTDYPAVGNLSLSNQLHGWGCPHDTRWNCASQVFPARLETSTTRTTRTTTTSSTSSRSFTTSTSSTETQTSSTSSTVTATTSTSSTHTMTSSTSSTYTITSTTASVTSSTSSTASVTSSTSSTASVTSSTSSTATLTRTSSTATTATVTSSTATSQSSSSLTFTSSTGTRSTATYTNTNTTSSTATSSTTFTVTATSVTVSVTSRTARSQTQTNTSTATATRTSSTSISSTSTVSVTATSSATVTSTASTTTSSSAISTTPTATTWDAAAAATTTSSRTATSILTSTATETAEHTATSTTRTITTGTTMTQTDTAGSALVAFAEDVPEEEDMSMLYAAVGIGVLVLIVLIVAVVWYLKLKSRAALQRAVAPESDKLMDVLPQENGGLTQAGKEEDPDAVEQDAEALRRDSGFQQVSARPQSMVLPEDTAQFQAAPGRPETGQATPAPPEPDGAHMASVTDEEGHKALAAIAASAVSAPPQERKKLLQQLSNVQLPDRAGQIRNRIDDLANSADAAEAELAGVLAELNGFMLQDAQLGDAANVGAQPPDDLPPDVGPHTPDGRPSQLMGEL